MKVYNYHYESRVYLGSDDADESPMEPGVFLIPANATTTPPPEDKFGYNIVWDFDKWIHVEKHVEQPEQVSMALENEYRAKALLGSSDWVLLSDVELENKEEWLQYRKDLREIATNAKEDSVIPERPQVVWK